MVVDGIVIAAELLARAAPTLHNGCPWRREDKVKSVRRRLRKRSIARNFPLQELLNGLVSHGGGRRGRGERNTSCSPSMPNGLSRNVVFAQLVYQTTFQDKIKKLVHFREESRRPSLFSSWCP